MSNKPADSVSTKESLFGDVSKSISLLFGILLFLAVFGLVETISMLSSGRPVGLIELIIFALLSADVLILLISLRERKDEKPGFFGYFSVWVLGLIPYFVWGAIYWAGKGISDFIQRQRSNAPVIALLLFIGIVTLCLSVYLLVSGSAGTSLSTQN